MRSKITLFRQWRITFLIASLALLLGMCKKAADNNNNNNNNNNTDTTHYPFDLNDSVLWVTDDDDTIDINKDGINDIAFDIHGWFLASGAFDGNGKLITLNADIEFLADSFIFYYCSDTSISTYGDTSYYYSNCISADNASDTTTGIYAVARHDSIFPIGGFYPHDTVKLYYRATGHNPVYPYTYEVNEGEFINETLPSFVFLRWNRNGVMSYYSIKTEWSLPRFYIKRVFKYP